MIKYPYLVAVGVAISCLISMFTIADNFRDHFMLLHFWAAVSFILYTIQNKVGK